MELPDLVSNTCMRHSVSSNLPTCSSKGLRDPLFMVTELCESGDNFIQVVTTSPEVVCVLASDQQLSALV